MGLAYRVSSQIPLEGPRRMRRAAPVEEYAIEEGVVDELLDEAAEGDGPMLAEGDSEAGGEGVEDESMLEVVEGADDARDVRDLDLAGESSDSAGHEVTFPPPEDDQNETERIVTEAVVGDDREPAPEAPGEAD
jgi:hypothetical protein